MKKMLTEQKVLHKLGITDFRHLTKDKVMEMASMLDRMDPEVAKKAIEQFPDFSETMSSMVTENKSVLEKSLEENGESIRSYYESCDAIIQSCQKELDKDNLSFEERKQVIGWMIEVANLKGGKDTENKQFIKALCVVGVGAVGIAATVLLTALGGNTKLNMEKI